jgi:hypothetical protein
MLQLEGLGQLKKSNDLIGNRTRDLLACSKLPQPTTLCISKDWKSKVRFYSPKKKLSN